MTLSDDGRPPIVPGEQVPHFAQGSAAVPVPATPPIDQTHTHPVLEVADHARSQRRWTRRRKQVLGAALVALLLLLCLGLVVAMNHGRNDPVEVPAPVVSSVPPATRAALGDAEATSTPAATLIPKKGTPRNFRPTSKRPRKG